MTVRDDSTLPGPRATLYLALLGAVLGEYSLWPMGQPGFEFGGLWSLFGNGLLLATVALLALLVARPLLALLRRRLLTRSRRRTFLLLWLLSAFSWMWLTSELGVQRIGSGPVATGIAYAPVLGPFGMLPSLEFLVSPGGFEGYLSPLLALVLLLSLASSGLAALLLFPAAYPEGCGVRRSHRRPTSLAIASWIPAFGLTLSCCAPPLLGVLALAATGSAGLALLLSAAAPLTNGLLIVGAMGFLIAGLRAATRGGASPRDRPGGLSPRSELT